MWAAYRTCYITVKDLSPSNVGFWDTVVLTCFPDNLTGILQNASQHPVKPDAKVKRFLHAFLQASKLRE